MPDRGFNSFASYMIKLSVNETKWSSLLARTLALILSILIWIFDFGPEKLPGLSRNGPLAFRQNFCYHYIDYSANKLKILQSISNSHIFDIFFLSYSSGIETIKTFIQSLQNHTRFQTKMGKVYACFQTQTAKKPYPMGRHIPIYLI